MADSGRKREAWATELAAGIVNAFPAKGSDLLGLREHLRYVQSHSLGGVLSNETNESFFIWGPITRLGDHISPMLSWGIEKWKSFLISNQLPNLPAGRVVVHADSLSSICNDSWGEFLSSSGATRGLFEGLRHSMKKADILIAFRDGSCAGLSVKLGIGKKEVKLSQQSGRFCYEFSDTPFTLRGGLSLLPIEINNLLPTTLPITHEDTDLTPSQFAKLTSPDQQFAAFKKSNPTAWMGAVKAALAEATLSLLELGVALTATGLQAAQNLKELLTIRLLGKFLPRSDANLLGAEMWLSGQTKVIPLSRILENRTLLSNVVSLEGGMRKSSSGKASLIIQATTADGKQYVVSKIEPSFDGWKSTVSQTKGIIFYFQEGRQLGLPTVWDLLETLSI